MWRNWASWTSTEWRIVCATTEESCYCESDDGSDSGMKLEVYLLFCEQLKLRSQCCGAKKLQQQNQLMNLLHRDRSQDSVIFLIFGMLDAMIASALKMLINTQSIFRKRVSVEEQRAQNSDRFLRRRLINCLHDLQVFPCNRSLWKSTRTRRRGQYDFAEWRCPRFRCKMGSCTISEWDAFRPDPGRIVQVKNTEIRPTSDCDGIVWSRGYSRQWGTQLSASQNWSETSHWREIEISRPGTMLWKGDQLPRVEKETKPTFRGKWECFQWKAQRQCFTWDSCSFSYDRLLASGKRSSGSSQKRNGRSSSPALHSKAEQTDGEKGDKEENSDRKGQILCQEKCNNPSCDLWRPPVCQTYKSEKVVFGDKCRFRHVEEYVKPNKKSKQRWCERITCFREGVYAHWVVYLKILNRENLFYVYWECWDKTHRRILRKHLAPNQNSGNKGSIARYYPQVCASWASRQNSMKDHMRRPWIKNDAPAKQRGIWRKIKTNSRIRACWTCVM